MALEKYDIIPRFSGHQTPERAPQTHTAVSWLGKTSYSTTDNVVWRTVLPGQSTWPPSSHRRKASLPIIRAFSLPRPSHVSSSSGRAKTKPIIPCIATKCIIEKQCLVSRLGPWWKLFTCKAHKRPWAGTGIHCGFSLLKRPFTSRPLPTPFCTHVHSHHTWGFETLAFHTHACIGVSES